MAKIGFLFVGHGTRNRRGQEQFHTLSRMISQRLAPWPCEPAFLELAEPGIADGVQRLAERGVERLVVVPALLFTAGHALRDIPQAIQAATQSTGISPLMFTPPLEAHPLVVQTSIRRFREAVWGQSAGEPDLPPGEGHQKTDLVDQVSPACRQAPCRHDTSQFDENDLAVLFVGRGSSHRQAIDDFARFAAIRAEADRLKRWRVAYLHGGPCSLEQGLDWLEATPNTRCVVQPHLLFDGYLMKRLREEIRRRGAVATGKAWTLVPELGPDPALATAFVQGATNFVLVERAVASGSRSSLE